MQNDASQSLSLPWYRSTLALGLFGSLLLWAALPPLALGWLGWIAPVPWLLLVRVSQLAGRRPYRALWLAGFTFWMMTLQWLRLPHPATALGWIALSAYLACYLPIFVGLSRVAVHRLRAPLWLAAPVVWTGLELVRAHLFTGFLLASLAHTQVHVPELIQISDLVGEYGVDFVMMTVAAAITCVLIAPRQFWAVAPAAILVAATLGYGYTRLREIDREPLADSGPRMIRIALIQGNSLAEWKQDQNRERQIMDQYVKLSERAVALASEQGDGRPLDLIVWPETMFRTPLVMIDPGYRPPPEAVRSPDEVASYGRHDLASLVNRLHTPVLVGIERWRLVAAPESGTKPPPEERFNSAALVDRDGNLVGTYDKVHRVMFGEYIPFADWLPFLYNWTPLTGGVTAGHEPVVLGLGDFSFAASICYETVLPHVIRRQVNTLYGGSISPRFLVNLTNDAWYWGSSGLDLHLACSVFRAVETRLPVVIAANGGLSAWIDQTGRIRAVGQRQQPEVIVANIQPAASQSQYAAWGDWFAAACLTCCAILAIIGWNDRRQKNSSKITGKTRRQQTH